MKTTIDLPEQLIDEVKDLAAREQRKVDELVAELVRVGIESRTRPLAQTLPVEQAQREAGIRWLEEWLKLADELMKDAPPGPTAREILEEDRNRLERR
jgi:hypothetical protein